MGIYENRDLDISEGENQYTEWKWPWNDDFLKWLCGYANMDGGILYVGVNDDGYVVGLKDSRILLESLPNKINDKLGIVASIKIHHADRQGVNIRYGNNVPINISEKLVNKYASGKINSEIIDNCGETEIKRCKQAILRLEKETPIYFNQEGRLDYISIAIERYPFAISCDGKYYKRSGSTLRELQGFELQSFLLERAGKTWDSVPIPGVSVEDLDKNALNAFRSKAVKNSRMSKSEVDVSDEVLLKNLKLYDGNYLTRAAILLFHPDPEQYVTGAYIKIAFFAPAGTYGKNRDADIIYKDDIHGPLITQADRAMDVLYTKYFKALISYDKLQRMETYMLPGEIIRELLLNPVNHKQYEKGTPIQISVYEDHIKIFNVGKWPESIPIGASLYQQHESVPYNPKIADVFYRAGEIESWGRGFWKVRVECEKINAKLPILEKTDIGITINSFACEKYLKILSENKAVKENQMIEETFYILTSDGYRLTDDRGNPLLGNAFREMTEEEKETMEDRKKIYEYMLDVCSQKLSEREKKQIYPIIEYFKTHDEIDRATAETICGKGTTTTVGYLNRLIEVGVLQKQKESVATNYRITGL